MEQGGNKMWGEDRRPEALHLEQFPFWYQVVLMPELAVGLNDISLTSPGILPLLYGVVMFRGRMGLCSRAWAWKVLEKPPESYPARHLMGKGR